MIFALGVIVKTTILLALASLMTLGLRRASASVRHAVWAFALLGALLLPLASTVLPALNLAVLPAVEELNPAPLQIVASSRREVLSTPPAAKGPLSPTIRAGLATALPPTTKESQPRAAITRDQVILFLWALGASVVLIRLAIGSLTVRRLALGSRNVDSDDWLDLLADLKAELGVAKPVRLRIADRTIPPMTWGIFRHVVLLPASAAEWTAARRRFVLAHELAHVGRNDGVLQILLQAVCSVHWFNPLVWHGAKKLRIERECACDDRVLQLGADADDYADHLLQVARTINPGIGLSMATVAMAHRSQLETRLLSILDNRTSRIGMPRLASAALSTAAIALSLLIGVIQITAKPAADFAAAAWKPGLPLPGIEAFDAISQGDAVSAAQSPVTVTGAIRELGTNTPIASALVRLIPFRAPAATDSTARYDAETRTDGTFAIDGLPPGEYRVSVEREGFVELHSATEPTQLNLLGGDSPPTLQLHMMRGPAISGRVFDEGGSPKRSAQVELMRLNFRDGQRLLLPSDVSMVTDHYGEYRLFGLMPGEYYLRVRARAGDPDFQPVYFPGVTDSGYATPITVREGADISGVDLSLTRSDLHAVRLRVEVASPAPANPQLSFYVTPKRGAATAARGTGMQFHAVGDNSYVSPLLAQGTYEIEVFLRDPDPIRWAYTTVDIEDHDVDAGTLVVGPGVWIQGHVTAAESLPVSVRRGQLQVILRPLDGSVFLLPSAQVADDGSFVIPRVPERRFRIDLTGLPPEVYFASARYNGREVLDSGITVSAANRSVLDISIAGTGGVVAGVVRNSKDEPVSNGAVVLVPANRENSNLYRTASTDQFGVFSIPGVTPGEYGVLAWKEAAAGRSYLDPVFLKAVENQITKVVVQRGFTNTINVRAIAP